MIIKDPCGIVCIIITYLALFYAEYVVIVWIIMHTMQNSFWGPVNLVLFNTLVFLLTVAHMKAVLSDPGIVERPHTRLNIRTNEEDWTICNRCEFFRPPRAHHCRICKRCIRRMDHHCPWINNCVGERNQKFFLQFLLYVCLLAVYSVSLVVSSWMYPCNDLPETIHRRMLHSVLLLLESSLFGLFVIAIMIDQLHATLYSQQSKESKEALKFKRNFRIKNNKLIMLADICGHTHPMCWFFPCTEAKECENPLLDYDV